MLRWTSTVGDRRRAASTRTTCSRSLPSSATRSPSISPAELQGIGLHRGPPARLAPRRLPGAVVDRGRGRTPAARPASASSTPTTAASTRRPRARLRRVLRRRAAHRRPPRRRRARRPRRRAPCCSSPPITARSRSATASSSRRADLLDLVAMQSGEGRFRWWHARHGAADELAKAATERYGTSPGSSPAIRSSTSTGSVRPSPRPSPPASATWRSSRSPRSASTTRSTPARSS